MVPGETSSGQQAVLPLPLTGCSFGEVSPGEFSYWGPRRISTISTSSTVATTTGASPVPSGSPLTLPLSQRCAVPPMQLGPGSSVESRGGSSGQLGNGSNDLGAARYAAGVDLSPSSRSLCQSDGRGDVCSQLSESTNAGTSAQVKVFVRVRPWVPSDTVREPGLEWDSNRSTVLLRNGRDATTGREFTFDGVLGMDASPEDAFNLVGQTAVDDCFAGYNGSSYVYGQTGAGKTHTAFGPPAASVEELKKDPHRGLVIRALEKIFTELNHQRAQIPETTFTLSCSFLEIYKERITDLLEPGHTSLLLRADPKHGPQVVGLSEPQVATLDEACALLWRGLRHRTTNATQMNDRSSRSHAVFSIRLQATDRGDQSQIVTRQGKLSFVDLAGSERGSVVGAGSTERGRFGNAMAAAASQRSEASAINKSLCALTSVIVNLAREERARKRARSVGADLSPTGDGGSPMSPRSSRFVSYRDSKLTLLMKDSLGGNSRTSILAHVSPAAAAASETLSTLQFAARARMVRCHGTVRNVRLEVAENSPQVEILKEELKSLYQLLANLGISSPTSSVAQSSQSQTSFKAALSYQEKRQLLEDQYASAHRKLMDVVSDLAQEQAWAQKELEELIGSWSRDQPGSSPLVSSPLPTPTASRSGRRCSLASNSSGSTTAFSSPLLSPASAFFVGAAQPQQQQQQHRQPLGTTDSGLSLSLGLGEGQGGSVQVQTRAPDFAWLPAPLAGQATLPSAFLTLPAASPFAGGPLLTPRSPRETHPLSPRQIFPVTSQQQQQQYQQQQVTVVRSTSEQQQHQQQQQPQYRPQQWRIARDPSQDGRILSGTPRPVRLFSSPGGLSSQAEMIPTCSDTDFNGSTPGEPRAAVLPPTQSKLSLRQGDRQTDKQTSTPTQKHENTPPTQSKLSLSARGPSATNHIAAQTNVTRTPHSSFGSSQGAVPWLSSGSDTQVVSDSNSNDDNENCQNNSSNNTSDSADDKVDAQVAPAAAMGAAMPGAVATVPVLTSLATTTFPLPPALQRHLNLRASAPSVSGGAVPAPGGEAHSYTMPLSARRNSAPTVIKEFTAVSDCHELEMARRRSDPLAQRRTQLEGSVVISPRPVLAPAMVREDRGPSQQPHGQQQLQQLQQLQSPRPPLQQQSVQQLAGQQTAWQQQQQYRLQQQQHLQLAPVVHQQMAVQAAPARVQPVNFVHIDLHITTNSGTAANNSNSNNNNNSSGNSSSTSNGNGNNGNSNSNSLGSPPLPVSSTSSLQGGGSLVAGAESVSTASSERRYPPPGKVAKQERTQFQMGTFMVDTGEDSSFVLSSEVGAAY